jgi:dTDP-4-amino-4,6-dideoxygalactose transaminase
MEWKVKFFDYPLQFKAHEKEYLKIIHNTLSRGAYILGEDLTRFEENLARFVGSKYAIGVGNCTDALLLSAKAAGIGPGDEVITVAHTFVATVEVMKFLGAVPVFVDIADDHNMNVELVEATLSSKTKAIVPVQLNGRICTNMKMLVDLAKKYNIIIIEDSAQSLGATYGGKGAGTFGLSGNFSFYPAKLLGTFGDAGAIITNDVAFAETVRMLRNHGRDKGTDINLWGLNCRMDNVHAAILDYKLTLLPTWIKKRRTISKKYCDGLSGIGTIKLPPAPRDTGMHYDVFQNFEIEAERRDELMRYLREKKGIEVVIQWGGKAVHQFEALGLSDIRLPRTEKLFRESMMLPLYPEIEDEKIEYVIHAIGEFYAK